MLCSALDARDIFICRASAHLYLRNLRGDTDGHVLLAPAATKTRLIVVVHRFWPDRRRTTARTPQELGMVLALQVLALFAPGGVEVGQGKKGQGPWLQTTKKSCRSSTTSSGHSDTLGEFLPCIDRTSC